MVIDRQSPIVRQDGIALLVLVVAIALTLSLYYFSQISLVEIQVDKQQKTRVALKQAKQVLLAYAAVRAELKPPDMAPSPQDGRYGFLPCPANNNGEGTSVDNCEQENENSLGWFPWRSLKVDAIKDGNGDCLLYAVSGSYKSTPPAKMLNEDSNGMFNVVNDENLPLTGALPQDRVVAVIFSAGDSLDTQNRVYQLGSECGNDVDNFAAYLEDFEVAPGDFVDNSAVVTGNADEVYRFVQASLAVNKGAFNDQLITITREELWSAITSRADFSTRMANLTEALALCLEKYATANPEPEDQLPWPAPLTLADYRVNANYNDYYTVAGMPAYSGRFPFIIDNSNADIGAVGSAELFTQAACDNLGVNNIDLMTDSPDGYRKLYDNWKDHFFYAVSKDYAPDTATTAGCSSDCITVDTTPPTTLPVPVPIRAATVIFAGSREAGQWRNGPVGADANTKHIIANYIENDNRHLIPDLSGTAAYETDGGNDVMFCISDGLGVTSC